MKREDGIKEIDNAKWEMDNYQVLNLYVTDEHNATVWAWLKLRPNYCDRGHIQLIVDGPLSLDHADSFPRYFFSVEEADKHTREFLKWRLWKHSDNQIKLGLDWRNLNENHVELDEA